jgi:hypothetical protein
LRDLINPSLTKKEQKDILENMQKLTNDKLKLNKNNEVVSTNTNSKDKPKGTELVNRLIDSDKTVTITTSATIGKRGNFAGSSSSEGWDKGTHDGKGSDATVYFDKTSQPPISTIDKYTGKIVSKRDRPSQIGLGHELIHAEHYINGNADYNDRDKNFVKDEEPRTVGVKYTQRGDITENDLRKEQGVEPRARY